MTPAELAARIAQSTPMRFAEDVSQLSEAQRDVLADTAQELYQLLYKVYWCHGDSAQIPTYFYRLFKARLRVEDGWLMPFMVAELAVLALCPYSLGQKIRCLNHSGDAAPVVRVLSDRRPEWVDQWIHKMLGGRRHVLEWEDLRGMIQAGICQVPEHDGYIQLMAFDLPRRGVESLSRQLRGDPGLLQHEIWRLFEIKTTAFLHDLGDEDWARTLSQLAQTQYIDRGRLIDACLAGMQRDLTTPYLYGFRKLYEQLAPDLEEVAGRAPVLLRLLASPHAGLVTFALAELRELQKAHRLDGAAFVAAFAGVLDRKSKTQPKSALTLLQQLVDHDATLLPLAAGATVEALAHVSLDVQHCALKLLERWSDQLDAQTTSRIGQLVECVPPVYRERTRALANPP